MPVSPARLKTPSEFVKADRPDCALPLWRAGNTLLYEVPWEAALPYLAEADRIVLHEAPSP